MDYKSWKQSGEINVTVKLATCSRKNCREIKFGTKFSSLRFTPPQFNTSVQSKKLSVQHNPQLLKSSGPCVELRGTLFDHFKKTSLVNPQAPVAQKVADELVFRRFQGDKVEFFLIWPHWPPFRLLMRIFWNITIMFWVRWFYSLFERKRLKRKNYFFHTHRPLITSFYIKKVVIFCQISDKSAMLRNFLRNGRVRA